MKGFMVGTYFPWMLLIIDLLFCSADHADLAASVYIYRHGECFLFLDNPLLRGENNCLFSFINWTWFRVDPLRLYHRGSYPLPINCYISPFLHVQLWMFSFYIFHFVFFGKKKTNNLHDSVNVPQKPFLFLSIRFVWYVCWGSVLNYALLSRFLASSITWKE